MQQTLYVSDLDGTLLGNDIALSPYTIETINAFIASGGLFTYATARSHVSSGRLTAALNLHLPVITYNGTFVVDAKSGAPHHQCTLPKDAAARVIKRLTDAGVYPLVYSFVEGQERFSWVTGQETLGVLDYIANKEKDERRRPVQDPEALLAGDIFYLTIIDTHDAVKAAEPLLCGEPGIRIHTLRDTYLPQNDWLEVSPIDAGKDHALRRLREMIGVSRVVCFGDNLNDLPMFQVADEGYAVANAMPALRDIATGIIDSNEAHGVAKFIAGLIA